MMQHTRPGRRLSIIPEDSHKSRWFTLVPISCGCMASAAAMYPMDVVRALRMASASEAASTSTQQLVRSFVSAHGAIGLVRQGVAPEISRATLMRVVQFFAYPLLHEALWSCPPSQGQSETKLVAGMLASLPSSLVITPLENAKIALQLDHEKRFGNSTAKAAQHLWRRGVLAPYVGLQGVFLRSALSFGPYVAALPYCPSLTQPAMRRACGDDSPAGRFLGSLLGGLLAGSLGAALNAPFDLVRTNLQKQALALAAGPMSTAQILRFVLSPAAYLQTARGIVAARGLGALYMGLTFKIAHIGGTGALNAALIPQFKRLFGVERELI